MAGLYHIHTEREREREREREETQGGKGGKGETQRGRGGEHNKHKKVHIMHTYFPVCTPLHQAARAHTAEPSHRLYLSSPSTGLHPD